MSNRIIRSLLAIFIILTLVTVGYDLFVYASMNAEENGRLRDPAVMAALSEISNLDSDYQPPILLLHGFGGSPYDYQFLIDELKQKDTAFFAPCIAGHCEASARDLALSTSEQWVASAQQALADLKAQGYEQIDVVGFSLGGILALGIADDPAVRRVVLVNPYTEVPHRWYHLLPVSTWQNLLHNVVPYIRKSATGQITNRALQSAYIPAYLHLPVDAVRELDELSRSFWAAFDPPDKPILMIIAENDVVSSPQRMNEYAEQYFMREDDQILRVGNSNHVVLHDNDKEVVIAEILQFLEHP